MLLEPVDDQYLYDYPDLPVNSYSLNLFSDDMVLDEAHAKHLIQYVLMHKNSSTNACFDACLQLIDEVQFLKISLSKLYMVADVKDQNFK